MQRCFAGAKQSKLAGLSGFVRKHLFEEGLKSRAGGLGHEDLEPSLQQFAAFNPNQFRADEIHQADRAISLEMEITDGGEIEQISVEFQRILEVQPCSLEFFILEFQLDLMDLQFLLQAA